MERPDDLGMGDGRLDHCQAFARDGPARRVGGGGDAEAHDQDVVGGDEPLAVDVAGDDLRHLRLGVHGRELLRLRVGHAVGDGVGMDRRHPRVGEVELHEDSLVGLPAGDFGPEGVAEGFDFRHERDRRVLARRPVGHPSHVGHDAPHRHIFEPDGHVLRAAQVLRGRDAVGGLRQGLDHVLVRGPDRRGPLASGRHEPGVHGASPFEAFHGQYVALDAETVLGRGGRIPLGHASEKGHREESRSQRHSPPPSLKVDRPLLARPGPS